MDETEEIEEGDDGIEFECEDDGGVSKSGNEDNRGSLSFSSCSHSIKSSNSFKLMIFLSDSLSEHSIRRDGFWN